MQVARQYEDLKDRQLVVELPEAFLHRRVEVIVRTVDAETAVRRRPHPDLSSRMKVGEDILQAFPDEDWEESP